MSWLHSFFGLSARVASTDAVLKLDRTRLHFEGLPELVYAIGDIHGRYDLLLELEAQIKADCAKSDALPVIIMLGDYVDRGPQTAQIIDHLMEPLRSGTKRICLAGNHEETMLNFIKAPHKNTVWLEFGGTDTLTSYGFDAHTLNKSFAKSKKCKHQIDSLIPNDHIEFLQALPSVAIFPHHVFVHAGVRPQIRMSEQSDRDLMWIREDFLSHSGKEDYLVIHGHSPCDTPFKSDWRINVDTGAYLTSKLSAVKLVRGEFSKFLSTKGL